MVLKITLSNYTESFDSQMINQFSNNDKVLGTYTLNKNGNRTDVVTLNII
jgi:hypothetical protein